MLIPYLSQVLCIGTLAQVRTRPGNPDRISPKLSPIPSDVFLHNHVDASPIPSLLHRLCHSRVRFGTSHLPLRSVRHETTGQAELEDVFVSGLLW
jgi:hypothetical protein